MPSQPVIYLCNGFGNVNNQPRYKSIAAFYKSFEKDYLNTESVPDLPIQKPLLEADVKVDGLKTWEGTPFDVDFTVGQRIHRFRFTISKDQKPENSYVGGATEINHNGEAVGEPLAIYRADNGGQTHPLQAIWARQGWYFLRVYYCTAAQPRTEPFKLQKTLQEKGGPLIPVPSHRRAMVQARTAPEALIGAAEEDEEAAHADENLKDGLDPEGNKLPDAADAPPQDTTDTGDWPEEQNPAKGPSWKDEADPAPLVENDGTLDLDEAAPNGAP